MIGDDNTAVAGNGHRNTAIVQANDAKAFAEDGLDETARATTNGCTASPAGNGEVASC